MRYLILTLCLCFLAVASMAQNAKTLIVRPQSGDYAGKTFYTNSHALLIGIRQYEFLPKEKWLDYADQDAKALREMLIRSYGFLPANVTLLLNDQATRANIEGALSVLADDNRVKRDDRVLVFFSGHGQTVKLTDGSDRGFLIPYDAKVDLAHPENRGPYLSSCLQMDNLWNYLEASPARHRLLLADACYGGLLARSRKLGDEKPNPRLIASLLTCPALQVITAGGKDEEAFEDPKLGHGAFTYKLLEELRAQAARPDTVFLCSELAATLKISIGNMTNSKQTPQFGNHGDSEGEFIFVSTEPRSVPAITTPITSPTKVVTNSGGGTGTPVYKPDSSIVSGRPRTLDGAELVYIPAGSFQMGDDDQKDNPRHTLTLSAYWMYKNLVTVGEYKQFCQAMGKQMPSGPSFDTNWSQEDHPMVRVTWEDAMAYAKWAGAELPTEAQFEKVARGTERKKYPWGGEFVGSLCANSVGSNKLSGTVAIGSYQKGNSPYGCTDMAGNVWEWCRDRYDADYWKSDHGSDPVNENRRQMYCVVRGGSWDDNVPDVFRAAFRNYNIPSYRFDSYGFRCVFRASPSSP